MEDFDVFTNEINFTKPVFKNVLNKFAKEIPLTPSSANYHGKYVLKFIQKSKRGPMYLVINNVF